MDGYKKIFRSRKVRTKILKILSFVPDEAMLKIQYYIKHKRRLNLKNPERFTEKLQWYKLNYHDPLMRRCTDKAEVRDVIEEWGMGDILTKCYGTFSSADEIDFDALPDSFVLKSTLGGGGNSVVLVQSKESADIDELKSVASKWVKTSLPKKNSGREWAYKAEKPKILVEELLVEEGKEKEGVDDFKFMCFNGKVRYIFIYRDRKTNVKRAIYDENWNYITVESGYERLQDVVEKPENFTQMCALAERLSEKFPFVRVDLYNVNGKIYFGELTFYPTSGYIMFSPDEFDYIMGEHFILPKKVSEK